MALKTLADALSSFDAGEVITKALAASAPKVASLAAREVRRTPERIASALGVGFSHHIQATYDKCYKIKTLIYREQPVELLSQYVPIRLGLKKAKIADDVLISRLDDFKNVIIQGSGGSGKTMFMKYLALCRFEHPGGRIPLFIELRTLDYSSGKPLEELIYACSASKKSKITFEQFEKALVSGLFLLILDGLDEVDPDCRKAVHRQILAMPVKYPDNLLVISSREDPSLDGWGPFYSFSVLPFDKRQITSVIKKIDFDPIIKAKFLKDLSSNLYNKHRSFLTNPLLATIMLLRYDQFANASEKVYIFYEQAFETLFFKHDISKGVYERKRYASISIDEFSKFFAAFSFSTYSKSKFTFSRVDIISFIEKALKYCNLTAGASSVLRDLIESVCIMQEDGLHYTFVHRSFQEYFAALFVSGYRGSNLSQYVATIMQRNPTESAGRLLKEMSPSLVDRIWAFPLLTAAVEKVQHLDPFEDAGEILRLVYGELYLDKDAIVRGFGIGEVGSSIFFLAQYYDVDIEIAFNRDFLFANREELLAFPNRFEGEQRAEVRRLVGRIIESRTFGESVSLTDAFWAKYTRAPDRLRAFLTSLLEARSRMDRSVAESDEADRELL